tara:strand:+ start:271 stop:444 length:174 start_codon:yes stop_codon:yes gene_type:complete
MKWCVETATGSGKMVPDDYIPQPGEQMKDLVQDAPAEPVAPAPAPEEEEEEEEEEED